MPRERDAKQTPALPVKKSRDLSFKLEMLTRRESVELSTSWGGGVGKARGSMRHVLKLNLSGMTLKHAGSGRVHLGSKLAGRPGASQKEREPQVLLSPKSPSHPAHHVK